jgi:hypothetical protein
VVHLPRMGVFRLVVLFALSGCCLTVVGGGTGNSEGTSGGLTTGGSTTSGGGSSGGSSTGAANNQCSTVYCSPSYACDPIDGICKCGGAICVTGNCDAASGACLPKCSDAGLGSIAFPGSAPGEATALPIATLDHTYNAQLAAVSCQGGSITFTFVSPQSSPLEDLGLNFYPNGQIEGVPTMATPTGMPFEFEIAATDESSPPQTSYQNVLLTIEGTNP